MQKYVSAVRDAIRELFHEYCGPSEKSGLDTSTREARIVEFDGFDSDSLEDWDEHLNAQTRSQLNGHSLRDGVSRLEVATVIQANRKKKDHFHMYSDR